MVYVPAIAAVALPETVGLCEEFEYAFGARKSDVEGKCVDLGGRRIIKKQTGEWLAAVALGNALTVTVVEAVF